MSMRSVRMRIPRLTASCMGMILPRPSTELVGSHVLVGLRQYLAEGTGCEVSFGCFDGSSEGGDRALGFDFCFGLFGFGQFTAGDESVEVWLSDESSRLAASQAVNDGVVFYHPTTVQLESVRRVLISEYGGYVFSAEKGVCRLLWCCERWRSRM